MQLYKFLLTTCAMLFVVNRLVCQVTISGPNCVIPGLPYQYIVSGNLDSTDQLKICVTGGVLSNGLSCTNQDSIVTILRIVWRDTIFHKLELQSLSGNIEFGISATHELTGGSLHDSDKVRGVTPNHQQITFRCDEASGGTCSPYYEYQWQKSINCLNWTNIAGATLKDLLYLEAVKVNTYFRRVAVEKKSNSQAYSQVGLLEVVFDQ